MEQFAGIDPVIITVTYPTPVLGKWPYLLRAVRAGAKVLEGVQQLGKVVLSPVYYCVKYPVCLIASVMRLRASRPDWVDSFEGAKAVLKLHRNGTEFHDDDMPSFMNGVRLLNSAHILRCEQDQTKHLRGIYQDLFSSKENRQKISDGLQQLLPKIQLQARLVSPGEKGYSDTRGGPYGSDGPYAHTGSLSKNVIGAVLGLQFTKKDILSRRLRGKAI